MNLKDRKLNEEQQRLVDTLMSEEYGFTECLGNLQRKMGEGVYQYEEQIVIGDNGKIQVMTFWESIMMSSETCDYPDRYGYMTGIIKCGSKLIVSKATFYTPEITAYHKEVCKARDNVLGGYYGHMISLDEAMDLLESKGGFDWDDAEERYVREGSLYSIKLDVTHEGKAIELDILFNEDQWIENMCFTLFFVHEDGKSIIMRNTDSKIEIKLPLDGDAEVREDD